MVKIACLASISTIGANTGSPREVVEKNLRRAFNLVKEAVLDKPDVICLPEVFPTFGLSLKEAVEVAEPIPNTITETMGKIAKEHKTYIICPMFIEEGGKIYNSAILIDRKGDIVDVYYKVHPTIGEIEVGVTPGRGVKVIETDFGKIGIAICFDLNFDDLFEEYRKSRVKVIFFPSAYPGGFQVPMRAYQCACYFVTSILEEGSMIVDPLGRILTKSSTYNPVISKRVNLDYEVLHLDYNFEKMKKIKEKYGPKIELNVSRPEGVFMLMSHTEEVSAMDVIKEFNMELRDEYFKRSLNERIKALK